jgi:FAD/FMN-containing dehydrogenase
VYPSSDSSVDRKAKSETKKHLDAATVGGNIGGGGGGGRRQRRASERLLREMRVVGTEAGVRKGRGPQGQCPSSIFYRRLH